MMKDAEEKTENDVDGDSERELDNRREFLNKCGKFAIYTAPAITALLLFDKKNAFAASPQPG